MARPKNQGPRVLGPYLDRYGWRIVEVKKNGTRESYVFPTEEEAAREKDKLALACQRPTRTIREAMKEYEAYMREDKGNKERSVDQTKRKLWRFFPDLETALVDLDADTCAGYYDALRRSRRKAPHRIGRPQVTTEMPLVSVDYHRNALSECKTFLNWCVKKKWIAANPLADVEGVGRRKHGKEQHRIDEARKWLARAVELADREDEEGAVAAMMTLLMGLRCSEIVGRVVRDVDDNGRLLWIPDAKTPKGKRALEIPEEVRPFIAPLCEGKRPDDALFMNPDGKHYGREWPRKWVQRICDEVGVPKVTAHGQRGLHGTLAVDAGITARAVADALGHESFRTTAQSYARPEAVVRAKQRRVLTVLNGGKSAPNTGSASASSSEEAASA